MNKIIFAFIFTLVFSINCYSQNVNIKTEIGMTRNQVFTNYGEPTKVISYVPYYHKRNKKHDVYKHNFYNQWTYQYLDCKKYFNFKNDTLVQIFTSLNK